VLWPEYRCRSCGDANDLIETEADGVLCHHCRLTNAFIADEEVNIERREPALKMSADMQIMELENLFRLTT
jgi:hypothetical protein